MFTHLITQAQIKENIKAPGHWPLCGEFTQMASKAEKVSIDVIMPLEQASLQDIYKRVIQIRQGLLLLIWINFNPDMDR